MSASIGEISRQVQTSSRIAQDAVAQAAKTDARDQPSCRTPRTALATWSS